MLKERSGKADERPEDLTGYVSSPATGVTQDFPAALDIRLIIGFILLNMILLLF